MSDLQVITRLTLTIQGNLASLKNSRRLVYVNGKPKFIPKPEAVYWEKLAQIQIPKDHRIKMTGPIRLTCNVWYQSRRSDLDIALVMDVLQRAEVYLNDRQVVEIIATKKVSPENPRVDLIVEELAD